MRVAPLLAALAFSCTPAVHPQGPASYDDDLDSKPGSHTTGTTATATVAPPRAEAPAGKGTRSGTIDRAHLTAVLDAGPAAFLRQVEVEAHLDGQRFIGWQLVQLVDRTSPLADVDVVPGDVLLAVNGNSLARPDQLQTVWDGLRKANEVTAELWRGNAKLELHFAVEPKI